MIYLKLKLLVVVLLIASCSNSAKKINNSNSKNLSPYRGDTSIYFIHEYGHLQIDTTNFRLLHNNIYINEKGLVGFKSYAASDSLPTNTTVYLTTINGVKQKESERFGEIQMKDFIDTATFESINGIYFKDKRNLYLLTPMSDGGHLSLVDNVDKKSFRVFGGTLYAKDKNYCFRNHEIIEGADPKTFNVLDTNKYRNIAFDTNNFYEYNTKVSSNQIKFEKLDSIRKAIHGF